MAIWKEIMSGSIREAGDIAQAFGLTRAQASAVISRYPALVNPYFRRLAEEAGDPLLLQVRPDPSEISPLNDSLPEDPIGEESFSPVPNLTHRYPDRVLFLVSDRCAVTCRFCTRKRKVGRGLRVTPQTIREGLRYIAGDGRIRDVLLSGGDPLMLEDDSIEDILSRLRGMDHVEILRVGTRIPAVLPQRVTPELAAALSRQRPLYVHVHFNHPAEITPEAVLACDLLADAGIPMSSQTVLLAGVNDDPDVLESLFRKLVALRVRPYYLFQVDVVRGTEHFRTPLRRGLQIMEELHRRTSPMALPYFAVDLPMAGGKVFPALHHVVALGRPGQALIAPDGTTIPYPDPL